MNAEVFFTQMKLDRQSSERKSPQWIKTQRDNEHCVYLPMFKGDYFFTEDEKSNKSLFQFSALIDSFLSHLKVSKTINECLYFLGTDENNVAIFTFDLSADFNCSDDVINRMILLLNTKVALLPFRQCLHFIHQEQASILGYSRSLSSWHQSAKYCGVCGSRTINQEAGHSRQCQYEHCAKLSFPRTDPVVIMIVEYQEANQVAKCLLAGHTRSPSHLLSTIAGFVDPGESLEQAVIREVYEEVGLDVESVEYIVSQPWSFPHSLMVGFYVKAKTNNIVIDTEELSSAAWFTADEINNFADWGEDSTDIQIPRKESISRYLIDYWLNKHTL